ncbi:hypothetical protein ALC53_04442 [Atta colombica]|uniref:Uncharacterized protein n=1 Tax=Atta colombica TaxID=520822 RepID=A0A195BLB8_9HYME|nr:hypothetical protein ALC53_04442 [Atta colombica]
MCQDCKLFMTETNELISCSTSPKGSKERFEWESILHTNIIIPFPLNSSVVMEGIIWNLYLKDWFIELREGNRLFMKIPEWRVPEGSSMILMAMRSRYQESGLSMKDWEARCGAKVLKPHRCEKVDRKISRFTAQKYAFKSIEILISIDHFIHSDDLQNDNSQKNFFILNCVK